MSKSISIIFVIVNIITNFCQSIYIPDKTSLHKFAIKLQYFNISSGLTPLDIELEPFSLSQNLTFFNDTFCHQISHRYIEDCSLCINNLQRKAMLDKVREDSTLSDEFIKHDSLTVAITSVHKHFIDSRGSSDSSKSICLVGTFSLQLLRAIQLVNVNRSIKLIFDPANDVKEARNSTTITTSIIIKLNSDANFEQFQLINIEDLIKAGTASINCNLLHVRLTEEDERISNSLQLSLPSPIEEFVHMLLSASDSNDSNDKESTMDIILESEAARGRHRSFDNSNKNSNKQHRLPFDWLAHHTAVPSLDTIQFDQNAWTSNDAINCHLPVRHIVAENSSRSTVITMSVGTVRRLNAHPFQHYYDHALHSTDAYTYTGTNTNNTNNTHNMDNMSSGGQTRITGDSTSGTYLRRSPVFADRVVWEFHFRNTSNSVNDLAYERMRRANNYTIDHSKFTPEYTTPVDETNRTGARGSSISDEILSFVSFSYNGEMVVQLHLEYLYAHVDCFIITEAWHTFSGNKKKELYIHKYRDLFLPYIDKIQFIVIDSFPAPSTGWQKSFQLRRVSSFDLSRVAMEHVQQTWFRETFQRDVVSDFLAKVYGRYASDVSSDVSSDCDHCSDCLLDGDGSCDSNSGSNNSSSSDSNSGSADFSKCCSVPQLFSRRRFVLYVVDSDEIASAHVLKGMRANYHVLHRPVYLMQDMFYYDLRNKMDRPWFLASCLNDHAVFGSLPLCFARMPQGGDELTVSAAGWHLSYFSSVHDIARKIQSFSHIELNTPEVTNVDNIRRNVDNGLDVFNRKDAILRRYDFNGTDSSLPDLFRTYQPIIRNYQADMFAHSRLLHATVFITVARHSDLSVAFGLRKSLLQMGFSKVTVSHELSLREVRRLKSLAVRDYNEHGLTLQIVVSSCGIIDSDKHNVDDGGSSYSGLLLRNYLLYCTSLTTASGYNNTPSSADSTQPTQSTTDSTQSSNAPNNMPRTGGLVEEAHAVLVTRDSAASAAIKRRVCNLTCISIKNVVVLPAEHHSPLYFDNAPDENYRQHSVHSQDSVSAHDSEVTSVDHMIYVLLMDSDGTDNVTSSDAVASALLLSQLSERFCAERSLSCISSSDIAATGMLTMGDVYTWEYFVTHSKVVVVAGSGSAQQDMVAIESLLRFNKCVLYAHSDHSNRSVSDSSDGNGVSFNELSDLVTIVPVSHETDYLEVLFAQLTTLLSRVNSVGSSCDSSRRGTSSLLPPERQLERDMTELQEIVFDVLEAI